MHIQVNVFNLLARPIREALSELGFHSPTAPQVKAIPQVLKGENVLLIAPTGSGKTEAILLPVFSNFIQQPKRRGINILYITPLRALNRDMVQRLGFWSKRLGLAVEVRHGDTEIRIRRRQARKPPEMLVTTPETLQAILPGMLMKEHLRNVQYVIIDEVHELAGEKRGAQLTIALERLREIAKREFQRIGLSATIGNPWEVARFIAGINRKIRVIDVSLSKNYEYFIECPVPEDKDYDLAGEIRTSPEALARIRRIAELVERHNSTLIFVNSRTNAEMLGHKFTRLGRNDIAVHHGSLSKEERTRIEDEFKALALKAIICTSTLELGIDIGHVDLTLQYLSPRQVCSLIQRVGRSGHRLDLTSKGIIITAFPDDTLEAIAAVSKASKNELEPVKIHENALDVLAHQIAGILMDKQQTTINDIHKLICKAYPFRKIAKNKVLDVVEFLDMLGKVRLLEGGKVRKTRKTREYYYENLSMIPDERRYPIIDIISDRKIGTLGDEFMALRARIGLNFICKGKVWRIVQIEDETGKVHVVPSEDPLAAIPGWDGELLPVSFELAQETGKLREKIARNLGASRNEEKIMEEMARELSVEKTALRRVFEEIKEHLNLDAPVPSHRLILIEGFDKYVIIHACFGETVNRTLGCIFDAVLSDEELIVGWWNDGYRILIEAPRKVSQKDLKKITRLLFNLTSQQVDKAFQEYLKSRFPFAYKMKFVAERFGALPRGKTMGPRRLKELPRKFERTPVYEETLREALQEKVDLKIAKRIMRDTRKNRLRIEIFMSIENPTPLAHPILQLYAELSELMAPERVILSNIEKMRKSINARKVQLLCINCGEGLINARIRELPEKPLCQKCNSGLLAPIRFKQNIESLKNKLKRRLRKEKLSQEELEDLTYARRTADLVLSYGKKALIALQVKGIGPETASRILGKMHQDEKEFYMDLLKAKIQYLRTRPFWDEKETKSLRA
jgi:ATP-dependent Lhr-like helicase